MAVSINPEKWERLKDLREAHERLSRRADEVYRLFREGQATEADLEEADRLEKDSYAEWQNVKWPRDTVPSKRSDEPASHRDDPEIPRDL